MVKEKQLSPKKSLWAPFRDFTLAEDTSFTFRSRTLWAAAINMYFAYRYNILRDAAIQLLAGYLADSTLVSPEELCQFFQETDFAPTLTRKLFSRVKKDLERLFPDWDGAQPTWHLYLNELRQVRNRACKTLSDELLAKTFQSYTAPAHRAEVAQPILTSFQKDAQRHQKSLPEYFAGLLVRKLKWPLRQQFREVWENYFRKKRLPHELTGVPRFLYHYLVEFVQGIPNSRQQTVSQMWQRLIEPTTQQNRLKKLLETTRPFFEELLGQLDLEQLAHQGIEAVVQQAYVKTSTGSEKKFVIPHKAKVFRVVHRATLVPRFPQTLEVPLTAEDTQALQACLEDFLRARFQRRAEEVIRPALVPQLLPVLQEVLKNSSNFQNKTPAFQNPGFSLAIADKQMYALDLEVKEFKLVFASFPKTLQKQSSWCTFTLHDEGTPHAQKRQKVPRLEQFLTNGWKTQNPTLVYREGRFYLHIPFAKQAPLPPRPTLPIGKRSKEVEEIVLGVDLNVGRYAVMSVLHTHSYYKLTPTGKVDRQLLPDKTPELAHYYIGDVEALDVKFDPQTGTFKNGKRQGQHFNKRKSTSRRGKGKLRFLRQQIRVTQAQVNHEKTLHPLTYETRPFYPHASDQLSAQWGQTNRILTTIAQSVAAKLRDIACYYAARYPHLPIRVQVEDLRWSRHGTRSQVGTYLAHNQILFFHQHIQIALAHLLREHGIGVWRVDPRGTSQLCAYCGQKGWRRKSNFRCANPKHRTPNGSRYTCHADLNAARNIAQRAPCNSQPILP